MEFGIFNLMGSRDPEKPTAEVFSEVAEQTRLAEISLPPVRRVRRIQAARHSTENARLEPFGGCFTVQRAKHVTIKAERG
jgi:hypothetical protein